MLKRLRIQLTLLYILAALSLVLMTGFGSYTLLKFYFQKEIDLALEYKMATQFRQYGLVPPPELRQAEQNWQANMASQSPSPTSPPPTAVPTRQVVSNHESEGEDGGEIEIEGSYSPTTQPGYHENENEDRYNGQLASIYVLPIDASGKVIQDANQTGLPFTQDKAASQAALVKGHDLRTITLENGTRVRLLTYRLVDPNGSSFILQLGRTLVDQDQVLSQFLFGLIILGSAGSIFLGLGSWWLSGRSLGPAQKAWEQQQAFVANASHELRTPLTLIRASAEVGLRSKSEAEQKELLQDILGECDYVNHLVDDLLMLSRLDARRLKLTHEPVVLRELFEETIQGAEKLAAGKGIQMVIGKAEGIISGDRTHLRQVLLILLDNAIRFTPSGGAIQLESNPKRKTHQIIVSDNGSGIAPEHLPHLFERFYQVNPSGETLVRGNGLGLSIAKGIIEAQGGSIHVQSRLEVGTRVILELPAWERPSR